MIDKLDDIINSFFKDKTQKNEAIFLIGTICSGKTKYRNENLSKNYVILDAGEIYLKLYHSSDGFGEHLNEELLYIGNQITQRILKNRYSFVVELSPKYYKDIIKITKKLKEMGYKTTGIKFDVTEEEAEKRNKNRDKNNISSYFTESYNIAWLINNTK